MTSVSRVHREFLDDRVQVFRVKDEVDATVIHTELFVALIDTLSTPSLCQAVLDALGSAVRDKPLIVINTHADWDHVWGNAAVADRPIIAHADALARWRAPEAAATLQEKTAAEPRFAEVTLVEPNITFTDELTLNGGDLTLHLIHTPGHTDDHVAVWIPEIALCLAGDAAEEPIPEVTTAQAGDLVRMRASLHRLMHLNPRTVLPSHGGTTDPGLLARNLAYFDGLAHRVDDVSRGRLHDTPSLGLDQFVSTTRPLTDGLREFYEMCHRKALAATWEGQRYGALRRDETTTRLDGQV